MRVLFSKLFKDEILLLVTVGGLFELIYSYNISTTIRTSIGKMRL